jgi:hypothetical protein
MKTVIALLSIAGQASAQTPNVSASLQELRLQRTAFARSEVGPVFDLRNQLELSFSRANSEPTADNIRLSDALNRYAQLLTNAESATSVIQKIRPDSTAIENRAAVGDLARLTINSVDLLNHITPGAGDELTELAAVAPGGALGKYLAFMRQLNVVARDGKAQIARAIDAAKTKVTVDITVRREERQGRTYPTNPLSLLTLSPEDEKFRDHLNATDLRAALAKTKQQGIDDLRQLVDNTLTLPIADLKAVAATVPDALTRIDAVLASFKSTNASDPEALVASILNGLTTLQSILGQESLTPYRERANAVVTAAKALANQLPDEVKSSSASSRPSARRSKPLTKPATFSCRRASLRASSSDRQTRNPDSTK